MPIWSKDHGQGLAQFLAGNPFNISGKGFIVGDSGTANDSMIQELFGNVDPDGKARHFRTIDAAVSACTANAGDVVYVLPGHAETISAAAGIACDIAGVSIIGLGNGEDRPIITFDGADATPSIAVSVANVRWSGFIFKCNEASLNHMFDVTGTDLTIENCDFREGTTTGLSFITADTADTDSDRLIVRNCRFYQPTAGNGDNAIQLAKDFANVLIENCEFDGDFDDACIHLPAGGNACANLQILNCTLKNRLTNTAAISINGTTCSGIIRNCFLRTDTQATALDNGSLATDNVTWADETDQVTSTPVLPAVDSATNFIGVDDADNAAATTNVAANRDGSVLERLEAIYAAQVDDVATNFIGVDDANNVASTTLVAANEDGSMLERLEFLQSNDYAMPRCVEKSDGSVTSGTDDLFTITGGPISILEIVGIVTTIIGAGTTNVKLQMTTTDPAATVDMNAAAVDIDADAVGTSYRQINTTAILTPVTAGFVMRGNAFATNDTTFLAPIGTIKLNSDASRSGVIKWYMRYIPLSPNSRVVAAA